jgi:zinc protease
MRYVSTPEETIEDLKKVTLADVRSFYQQFYGISEAELAISGQFDKVAVQKLVGDLFGEWKSPLPYKRPLTPYAKVAALDRKIETPDKQNAFFIAAVKTKMSDEDADYPAMVLANYIIGGSSASRLYSRIRDKEGLSYAVQSSLSVPTKDDGAMFRGLAICAPQNAPKVEASFKDELSQILKDGFKADEVASNKKSWLEERSVARSQDGFVAGTLMSRDRFERTFKWDEALEAKVAALTPDQVTEAFRRHVDAAAISYVKAGDFKKAGVIQ